MSVSARVAETNFQSALAAALAIMLFLLLFGLLPFLLAAPRSCPDKADAIVILGGGTGERVAKSLELFKDGYASQFVLAGDRLSSADGQPIRDARADFLIKQKVPETRITYVFPSTNSWLEARSTLELMRRQHWEKVIVVSDPPHMLRLSYAWGKAFHGNRERFVLVATAPAWWTPWTWWSNPTGLKFVISEMAKLVYYIVVY